MESDERGALSAPQRGAPRDARHPPAGDRSRARTGRAILAAALGAGAVGIALTWWVAAVLLRESVSSDCGPDVGGSNLTIGGVPLDGLTPLAGCSEEITAFRSGKMRSSVVRGAQPDVEAALRSAGVPLDEILDDPTHLRRAGPVFLPSGYSPDSRARVPWNLDGGYHFDDVVEIEGREWDRSLTWGPAGDGNGWLLMLIFETGSM